MRIALVNPSNGSIGRGVGFYAQRLLDSIQALNLHEISSVPLSFNPTAYNSFDIVHFPYFDPFFLTMPLIINRPFVVTIHDLIPIVLTEHFPRGLRGETKWQIQKRLVLGASQILTDSIYSKNDIQKILGINKDKIDMVYLAPGEEFKTLKSGLSELRRKYSIDNDFLIYVGDVNYNKNIPGLLRAFAKLRESNSKIELFLVGKSFCNQNLAEAKEIQELIESFNLSTSVRKLGFVPTDDLVGLYNLASGYVHPAIYEGFGFPPLEALSCGCPVVCGRNSSLPELMGDCAIYANVEDSGNFSLALSKIVSMPKIDREKFKIQASKHVSKFSWEKTARETIKTYEKVLARN